MPTFFTVTDFDTYFHLFLIDYIRKKGLSNLLEPKRFIKPTNLNYPWFLHWLFSLFPKKCDRYIEKFFNPVLDSLYVVFLYCLTYYLTKSLKTSIFLGLLYLFTPATFSIFGNGPRIGSFTPRLFGEIIGSLVFICEYLYLKNDNLIFLILAVVFTSFVFLCSKFSMQAVVLISLSVTIFTLHIEILLVLIFGFVLSLLWSQGKYLKILTNQFWHLYMYFKRNLMGKTAVSNRNNIKVLWNLIKNKGYKGIVKHFLLHNTISILIYKYPLVVLSFWFCIRSFVSRGYTDIEVMVLSGFLVFIFTSLKWFLFLGEAERYINHVLFFNLFLVTKKIDNFELIWMFILYGIVYYIADTVFAIKVIRKNRLNKNTEKLINWLKVQSKKLKIATIPYHLGGWRIVYETKTNWLYDVFWINNTEKEVLKEFLLRYPYLDINKAEEIIDRYSLDYLIVDTKMFKNTFGDFKIPAWLKQIKIDDDLIALCKQC